MSIAEFTSALSEAAYATWFKNSGKNVLVQTTKELRPEAEQQKRTSFFLSTDTLIQIAEKLSGKTLTETETDVLIGDLLDLIDNKKAVLVQEDVGSKTVTGVYFRQVKFEKGISSILDSSLKSIKDRVVITEKDGKERPARISDFFQRGHVFGIAANVATQTARNLAKSQVTVESKTQLLSVLIGIRNKLIRDDLSTSNIKSLKFSLYAKYFKTPYKYLVEMQLVEVNRDAGNETAVFTNALRRYFKPENRYAIKEFLNRRDSTYGDSLVGKLINVKGSPSYKDLVIQQVLTVIGAKKKKSSYSIPNTEIAREEVKFDTRRIKADNAKKLAGINSAISKVRSIVVPKPADIEIEGSTASLEALLRSRLALQIRENMGTGASKNVLNYRTGRFAESATIERLTTSKAGMITVFYDYMKYPYATFSAGGAQEYPKSRDPKLLISKSIREIGAALVSNRLRAVVV